jgi:hypothetical protein
MKILKTYPNYHPHMLYTKSSTVSSQYPVIDTNFQNMFQYGPGSKLNLPGSKSKKRAPNAAFFSFKTENTSHVLVVSLTKITKQSEITVSYLFD